MASEGDGYRLAVSGYNGTAGDALTRHSGFKFSTRDFDQDGLAECNCAMRIGP